MLAFPELDKVATDSWLKVVSPAIMFVTASVLKVARLVEFITPTFVVPVTFRLLVTVRLPPETKFDIAHMDCA